MISGCSPGWGPGQFIMIIHVLHGVPVLPQPWEEHESGVLVPVPVSQRAFVTEGPAAATAWQCCWAATRKLL
jgi:hypothetical protein